MNPAYITLLDTARRKSKENRKFIDRLKKSRPVDLDERTHRLHDNAFEHIDCLQCANCCRTTGPLLKNKDINALSAYFKKRPSEFTESYVRTDEDGDYVFKTLPCPFLREDNCCSVYSERPGACREYPHTQQRNILQKLSITYKNTLICPAVAEVVEGLKTIYKK